MSVRVKSFRIQFKYWETKSRKNSVFRKLWYNVYFTIFDMIYLMNTARKLVNYWEFSGLQSFSKMDWSHQLLEIKDPFTAWKVSIFGVFLVCIWSEFGKIWTKKSANTDTIYVVISVWSQSTSAKVVQQKVLEYFPLLALCPLEFSSVWDKNIKISKIFQCTCAHLSACNFWRVFFSLEFALEHCCSKHSLWRNTSSPIRTT